ncbi:MAG: class I SAM-dependent methyltransferase [Planctomycetaceae bacterium]|nr:class I SAM-dependent methyltransferase [Planctomycetaceae bacterium]
MTSTVAEHYASHLAPIYSWMVGDFGAACAHASGFYDAISLPDGNGRTAIDLGCGHGVHAIPLGQRGYRVIAIDTSTRLLQDLRSNIDNLTVTTISADLMTFRDHIDSEPSLIVCMGDTLTHLPSFDAVARLVEDAADVLSRDGLFVLSFRDYVSNELVGTRRFIRVRSDESRIHTCFLEYRVDTVVVHDIIYNCVDSVWQMSVGDYTKIRLEPSKLISHVESNGFSLVHNSTDRGMIYVVFKRLPEKDS